MSIQNFDEAQAIINETTEREAINIAIFEILPKDGSRITYPEIISFIYDRVDPIHSELMNASDSYVEFDFTGRRRTDAIRGALQWFAKGASQDRMGNNWIDRNGKTCGYIGDGAERAAEYFAGPRYESKVEALRFMERALNKEIPIEEKPIVIDDPSDWYQKMSRKFDLLEQKLDLIIAEQSG